MKKFLLIFGLAAVILTGCAHKKADKPKGKKEEITTNLPIISQAEKQEVITKKLVFPKDEQGIQSSQIITYQGKRFIKVIMERITATDDSIKNAIKEVGLEDFWMNQCKRIRTILKQKLLLVSLEPFRFLMKMN